MHSAAGAGDDRERVPRLASDWSPEGCNLSPVEGFLLSRIDGRTPWAELRVIGGLPPEEVDRCLERWLSEGILVVGDEKPESPAADPAEPDPAVIEAALDPTLDLSEELQRRILEFEGGLERPYHVLLGVARDADTKAIKRAYFDLSKQFHPDRYFRRNIGGFGERLDRIFKKVAEAYELLSDPATRAEIEKSLAQQAIPEQEPKPGARRDEDPAARAARMKLQRLQRLRKQFRIPKELLAERRFKARQFFDAARAAAHAGNWSEAGASIRLAIAFDPLEAQYKSEFAAIQSRVHQARAEDLLERAGTSWDAEAQQDAMRLFEEALAYRPADPVANHRAAQLAIEMGDLAKAREYAETACEVDPENAEHHATLGRVLRREGAKKEATRALNRAIALDPGCASAQQELTLLKRRGRGSGAGGGKR